MTAAVVSRLCRRWRSRVPTKKHSKCRQARTSGGIAASVQCDGSLIILRPQAVAEQVREKPKGWMRLKSSCPAAKYSVKNNKVCSLSHSGMHASINTLVEFFLHQLWHRRVAQYADAADSPLACTRSCTMKIP